MTEKFYTNCVVFGNEILYRGIDRGLRTKKRIGYKPKLYLPSTEPTNLKTISGSYVSEMEFSSIRESKDFLKQYENVENFKVYGNTWYQYVHLADEFPNDVDFNIDRIVLATLDIETTYEQGFPDPAKAVEEIIAITFKVKDQYYVFGCKEFKTDNTNIRYFKCKDEIQLINNFLRKWEDVSPDIVSGWNVAYFDLPYLVNRITNIMGENEAKRLSPWKILSKRQTIIKGQTKEYVDLLGISILDYMELYKKFCLTNRENYRLDTIAYLELGENKLAYDEHESFALFYKNNYQKFIEYNIKDVDLVDSLEQKLQYINQTLEIAYDAKVNYNDVMSQVRMWDTIIFNHLKKNNVVIPQRSRQNKDEQYAGAFVRDPQVGLHNWVVSLDINALYPSLICQFNISPEMLKTQEFKQVSIDALLDKNIDLSKLKEKYITMAANGHNFDIERQGFIPNIIERMLAVRYEAKDKMIKAQIELERIDKEIKERGVQV